MAPKSPTPRPAARRRRTVLGGAALVLVIAAVYVANLFQPWKLWFDERVDQAAPVGPAAVPGSAFVSLDHTTSGSLVVLRGADGRSYLRFEGLNTDNGPDLKVYLSTNTVDGPEGAFDDDFVNLGGLQGNIGNQNYELPAGLDLSRFRSVVIWCDRFNSAFGAAPLTV